jgi:single-stranded-DNA-specific exonuclease
MKIWKVKEQLSPDLIEHLILSRGIKTSEERERFLNPDFDRDTYDPFLMTDMDKAVSRVLEAISKNEKIVVYGDYDADGICASAVIHDFFRKIGFSNFEVYIPDRYREGYGINTPALEEFAKNEVKLIITLDCGITDVKEIAWAKENGIDTVVLDHHEEGPVLPAASAVVDPKRKNSRYPFRELCGAAVAYKFVEAILEKGGFNVVKGWQKWLLDVVAIATITDMMPLVNENRVLLRYGLDVLKKTNRVGLNAMFGNLKINKNHLNEDDLAFLIGPRINATGRMDHATTGFNLLITGKQEEARWLVERVNEKNSERKSVSENFFKEAVAEIDSRENQPEVIVAGSHDWSPGLLGIVATKLVEKYKKPVFVWGKGEGTDIKGSCRRYEDGVDLVALMEKVENGFFKDKGGHSYSAGFSLGEENLSMLEEKINKAFSSAKSVAAEEILLLDAKLSLDDVNEETMSVIEKLRPFGNGNEKPVFYFSDFEVFGSRILGNGGVHLELYFKNTSGGKISAVGFFMRGAVDAGFKEGDKVDIAASIERNYFRGSNDLRLRIADVRRAEN